MSCAHHESLCAVATTEHGHAGLAEEKGISSELPVVVYDGGRSGSMFAARVWWALKCHGHPKPLILAGGWKAWVDSGGEEQLYEPCPLKVRFPTQCTPPFPHLHGS